MSLLRPRSGGEPDQAAQDPTRLRPHQLPLAAGQSDAAVAAHRRLLAGSHHARRHIPTYHPLARAEFTTIRLRLFKLASRIKLQIVYGLLCAPDGCPVAIEVFDGNTADPMTLASQIDKLKQRFHLDHVVLVGDRGMITQARITEDIKSAGLDWITALRAPAIKGLLESGTLQLSLFDQRDIASITAPEFPNERLVVCRNPDLAAEAASDGIYVVRTNLPAETFDDATTVRSYKSLALVERAFRCIKT